MWLMAWLAKKAGLVFMWPVPFYWIANVGGERNPGCFFGGGLWYSVCSYFFSFLSFVFFFSFFESATFSVPGSSYVCCCMNRNISACYCNQCVSSSLLFLILCSRILSHCYLSSPHPSLFSSLFPWKPLLGESFVTTLTWLSHWRIVLYLGGLACFSWVWFGQKCKCGGMHVAF